MEKEKNYKDIEGIESLECVCALPGNGATEKEKNYKDIEGIESLECVCALTFPNSATDFQKSSIVLAHMMASVREIVLKGGEVPQTIISRVCDLAGVMMLNCGSQK